MLKIYSVEQVRRADAYTIQHEPIDSIDLMERAATQCFEWILAKLSGKPRNFFVFCGPGNNGGDGLAIARMLSKANYTVSVAISEDEIKYSPDFKINLDRLKEMGLTIVSLPESLNWTPENDDIVVDSLFGSGLAKPLNGFLDEVINFINQLKSIVISIDIPSGLFADLPVGKNDPVIHADYTLSFQFPKTALFFSENEIFTGEWIILPIGLHANFIQEETTNNFFIDRYDIAELLKPRSKFSHKGTFGHALLISGSLGKMGAAVLASMAVLRAGAGLLTTHIPRCGYEIIQTSVPEAMASIDANTNECSGIPFLGTYSAIGIGPGLGKSKEASDTLKLLLQETKVPLVLDADALNILSENKTWQAFVPAGSILTPHPGEFERLAGKSNNGFERIQLLREYCTRNKVFMVLKGAYTITCTPGGNCYFNSTGNPGMATGGSGDVLTGIILGLMAQQYSPLEASLAAVYLHGLAGDLAAAELGMESMLASDILQQLGKAFQQVYAFKA
jgi:ADP-dependent NAD(P)H-hydrate dehydratase / NAD(P)H-hydrate epimerase